MTAVREASTAPDLSSVISQALRGAESTGGLRAFAVAGITCVVSWRPAGLTGSHEVRFALRIGTTRREHAAVIPDVSLLARTCEHHVREFTRAHAAGTETDLTVVLRPRLGTRTASPAERLRAILDLEMAGKGR